MKKQTNYLGLISCLTLLLSCGSGGDKTDAKADELPAADQLQVSKEQFEENEMQLSSLSQQVFAEFIQVSGTVDVPPENRAVVSAIHGGFVREIGLLVGDRVRRGQRIAILENPEFLELQQQYLETQADLPYLQSEFERQKILYSEKISSEKVYLQAQSALKRAEARNSSLRRQLQLLNIPLPEDGSAALSPRSPVFAPISGSITEVGVRKGAYVSKAGEIVEIVNRDHLHLELKVYEKDISKLHIGQPIRFRVPEISDKEYKASVHLIGSSVDADRSVQVHAHLEGAVGGDFLVGTYVRAEILSQASGESASVWSVPEQAVVRQGNKHLILLLESETEEGYRFRSVEVTPGRTSGGYRELLALDASYQKQQVLTAGAFSLVQAN